MQEVEIVDAMPITQQSGQMYALAEKSQLEAAIDAAHKYKRSLTNFEQEVRSMALIDAETAREMGYAKPTGDGIIKGPSVRLAEICAVAWGNLRYGSRPMEISEDTLSAEGFCFDCEKNTGSKCVETRGILTKKGERYKPHVIVTTMKAAMAIAKRNAIFDVIPRVFVDKIYNEAMDVGFGKTVSLTDVRDKAFTYVRGLGVSNERILAVLRKPGIADVTMDDVAVIKSLCVQMQNGEMTVEQAFPAVAAETPAADAPPAPKEGTKSRVKDKLKANAAEVPPAELKADPGPVPALPTEAEIDQAYHVDFTDAQRHTYDLKMNELRGDGLDPYDASVGAYLAAKDSK